MATSGSYNYSSSRDQVITRALRIVGAIGQGGTGSATAVTEAAIALNDLVKEWNADGMPLWCVREYLINTLTAATSAYSIGVGLSSPNLNAPAPLKVIHGHRTYTPSGGTAQDSPMLQITRDQYENMSSKASQGVPNMFWYDPPGNLTSGENVGIVQFYPTWSAAGILLTTCTFVGVRPFQDFDVAADVPDFPQGWYNALTWGLADQLSYEYKLPFAERSMITKKAETHKMTALSGGTEEGSFFFQPDWTMTYRG
jgi:hypothetical protein